LLILRAIGGNDDAPFSHAEGLGGVKAERGMHTFGDALFSERPCSVQDHGYASFDNERLPLLGRLGIAVGAYR
jgi:hypothetical protein